MYCKLQTAWKKQGKHAYILVNKYTHILASLERDEYWLLPITPTSLKPKASYQGDKDKFLRGWGSS